MMFDIDIDGVAQASFAKSRIGGKFDEAFSFMKSSCQASNAADRKVRTLWKRILFARNCIPHQLIKAEEMGVLEFLFLNKRLGINLSKAFTLDQIHEVEMGVKIRLYDYLSNFHDTPNAIGKTRWAILRKDPVAARSDLLLAANMIRRRLSSDFSRLHVRWSLCQPGHLWRAVAKDRPIVRDLQAARAASARRI
mgnify:CR=1 FL=1